VTVERALLVLAYIMELDGDVYVPIYERLEQDLEAHGPGSGLTPTDTGLSRSG
jgi:hypothetical protein